jgi:hypothetical protein
MLLLVVLVLLKLILEEGDGIVEELPAFMSLFGISFGASLLFVLGTSSLPKGGGETLRERLLPPSRARFSSPG